MKRLKPTKRPSDGLFSQLRLALHGPGMYQYSYASTVLMWNMSAAVHLQGYAA